MKLRFLSFIVVAAISFASCNDTDNKSTTTDSTTAPANSKVDIKTEEVTYSGDGVEMKGYIAYDAGKEGPRPAIIVVPEWWGLTDYAKSRARQLAELGYIAMAVDFYGNGKVADNPDSAGKFAGAFYANPVMARTRFNAAVAKVKTYAQTDSSQIAAIGYCFGGAQVLNIARMGENLKGVVSFHGNLKGIPADAETLKAKILVCHGGADPFVPADEVAAFKKDMEAEGIDYTFKEYAGATHAFTNPEATATGEKFKLPIKYDAAADKASWEDMKTFFNTIFK